MPPLRLPSWLHLHLLNYRAYNDLSKVSWDRIKRGLNRFKVSDPVVSIVMPAYNEEGNILRTLSSIASLRLADVYPTELIVVNDGSDDRTQDILDRLGVRTIHLPSNQGRHIARKTGLHAARGRYLLHADADSLYPPYWGLSFVQALQQEDVVVAYGPHAFVPSGERDRLPYAVHEFLGRCVYQLRRPHREYINVHGFNSALKTEAAQKYGSYQYEPNGSEDGHMAWMLQKVGKIQYVNNPDSLVWTSDRRLQIDGGLGRAFWKRIVKEGSRLGEYLFGKPKNVSQLSMNPNSPTR